MRYLRASDIVVAFAAEGSTARVLPHGKTIRASREVASLLAAFETPRTVDDVLDEYPEDVHLVARKAIEHLIGLHFLVPIEDDKGDVASVSATGLAWGPTWRMFHAASRDAVFLEASDPAVERHLSSIKATPQPATSKRYPDADVLFLPRVHRLPMSLQDAVELRRTHRDFSGLPVSLDQFSTLMHYSFAPLRFSQTDSWGALQFRASASGGARHESEPYVAVQNVAGVPAGLYHYNGLEHSLERLRESVDKQHLETLTFRQGLCAEAAFTVLLTAVSERLAYKYRHPRAYRILCHNVGHVGQTFALVATGLGLGAFTTAAFDDAGVEELLDLAPGGDEFATYVLGAGVPVLGADGLPHRYKPGLPAARH